MKCKLLVANLVRRHETSPSPGAVVIAPRPSNRARVLGVPEPDRADRCPLLARTDIADRYADGRSSLGRSLHERQDQPGPGVDRIRDRGGSRCDYRPRDGALLAP